MREMERTRTYQKRIGLRMQKTSRTIKITRLNFLISASKNVKQGQKLEALFFVIIDSSLSNQLEINIVIAMSPVMG